jgi:hypothetical protein
MGIKKFTRSFMVVEAIIATINFICARMQVIDTLMWINQAVARTLTCPM